jgi:hypothetical protein
MAAELWPKAGSSIELLTVQRKHTFCSTSTGSSADVMLINILRFDTRVRYFDIIQAECVRRNRTL